MATIESTLFDYPSLYLAAARFVERTDAHKARALRIATDRSHNGLLVDFDDRAVNTALAFCIVTYVWFVTLGFDFGQG